METYFWDGQFSKRLFSTISEQDFSQNVGEVTYSIYLAVYWPIAQNIGTFDFGNKDKLLGMSRQSWPTNRKDIFSLTLTLHFVLVLNALIRTSSDLLEFNQTHNAAMFSSKCETFALQIHHTYLLDILFVLKVKLGTFLPIHRCAFWFNLKYIFVLLCK